MSDMTDAVVREDGDRLFVEVDGVRFFSNDLPDEGTDVRVYVYTGIDDSPHAEVEWSADTPSGIGRCCADVA